MKAALLLVVLTAGWARAQTVSTLADHGDPANRIDLVILGEGYTSGEQNRFTGDARRFLDSFFGAEVYKEYAPYFNVRTVSVASNQAGASHPELNPPVTRDTAFGASYNCAGVPRLICVNNARVTAVVNPLLPANQRDFVVVLVNDPTYGGAGGSIMVSSTHVQAVEIGLHESGHTIGLLADEYTDQPPVCTLGSEPAAANATRKSDRAAIKWAAWIAPATAVPTLLPSPGQPGLFEGSDYCPSGKYRPTYNSKMRSLGNAFDAVNAEQLVRRFYNFVSAIDAVSPAEASFTAVRGVVQEFRVTPLAPATHALRVAWSVDGTSAGSGPVFSLDTARLSEGPHTVRADVHDVTTWVRNDPAYLLTDSQTWHVQVTAGAPPITARRPSIQRISGAGLSVPAVQVLSPGGLFSVFGSDFTAGPPRAVGQAEVSAGALPATLGQTCLLAGGVRAPLLYVSATQINAIAPASTASEMAVSVIADCGTAAERVGDPVIVSIRPAAPEFLGNPVAAVPAGARPGEIVTLFGIGFGPTASVAPPGTIAIGAAATLSAARVTVGGLPADVLYSGLAPGFAGLYQVNLIVPPAVAAGSQPVAIEVNGATSPSGAYLAAAP